MTKALLLIFDPAGTWEKIFRAQRSLVYIFATFLLPWILLSSAFEAYGLVHWGKWQQEAIRPKMFNHGEAVIYELIQISLTLLVVFLSAKLIKSLGETFHGRHTYTQAFTAVAYGLGPLFLFRLLDAFREVHPAITFSIGILLSIGTLYHGLPRIMMPDPPHAFGLFLMGSILLALSMGLARFVTAWYLEGRFTALESFISNVGARLPF